MGESFESWWYKLGPITKGTLCLSLALTIGFAMGVNPMLYVVDFESFIWSLHLWRPITSIAFLGKFGFPFLMELAMLVMYTGRHEEYFEGRRADMVWMMSLVILSINLIGGLLLGMMLLTGAYICALIWIFCRRHEDSTMSLYMFEFGAKIFPWVFLGFTVLIGKYTIVEGLMGFCVGHLYFFLSDVFPKTHKMQLLSTPRFVRSWFPDERINRGVHVNVPQARAAQADPGAHRWGGGGRALGN